MSYKHLSITEREKILIYLTQGLSLCRIAKLLGRSKSTISRELARNPILTKQSASALQTSTQEMSSAQVT